MVTFEVVSAVVGLLLGIGALIQGGIVENNSKNRNAVATEIAAIWDEIIKKYNVTNRELNDLLDSFGLKREALMDSFRYSARLSKAREIAEKFLSEYPDKIAQIKAESRALENRIADATKKRDQQVGEAQSGTRNDAIGSTWEASQHYTDTQRSLNGSKGGSENGSEQPAGTVINDAINNIMKEGN